VTQPLVAFRVDGIADVAAAFQRLGRALSDDAIKKAQRKAMEPVAAAARALAPRSSTRQGGKHLADTILIRHTLSKSQRRKNGKPRGPVTYVGSSAPHAHLVEFGHVLVHGRGTKRAVLGHVPAHPFLRPAWDSKKGEVVRIFGKELGPAIERTWARIIKQQQKGKLSKRAVKSLAGR
jgi:HK97 gp10 family phage protein